MCTCLECGKSIVSGDLCKFCKCFVKSSLINYAANKADKQQEATMTTQQFLARLRFQEILIKEGYSYEECANMDLVEMRDLVDELNPLVVVNTALTMRGGKTKRVTVIKKAA